MDISLPSILLGLGLKCLLNWALVYLQRSHICRSFVGTFSVSLSLVDTFLTLAVVAIYTQGDGMVLGVRLTRYHVCLLVQIHGQICSLLQWPVVILTGLDHYWAATRRLRPTNCGKVARASVTVLLWTTAGLFLFLLSGFSPVLEDAPFHQLRHCWVFHAPQVAQVALVLAVTAAFAVLYSHAPAPVSNHSPPRRPVLAEHASAETPDDRQSRMDVVRWALWIVLSTWTLFLLFVAVCIVLPTGIPAYLGLNVPWLCFLNSVWIGVVLSTRYSASQLKRGTPVFISDSFCDWNF